MLDPDENVSRLRKGLAALISGRSIEFDDATSSLIVVFDGSASLFSGGRILLFQQFFLDRLGTMPEIVRQVPACIKVFFKFGSESMSGADLKDIIATEEFDMLCRNLRITQVQVGQKLRHFTLKD